MDEDVPSEIWLAIEWAIPHYDSNFFPDPCVTNFIETLFTLWKTYVHLHWSISFQSYAITNFKKLSQRSHIIEEVNKVFHPSGRRKILARINVFVMFGVENDSFVFWWDQWILRETYIFLHALGMKRNVQRTKKCS